MYRFGKPSWIVLTTTLVATAVVGSAIADMVYDDETSNNSQATAQQMTPAPTQNKVEVKNVINTAEPVTTSPVVAEAPKLQKASEKSREKRGFQESMNNELVIQKLEERRLKQEEKLTTEINKRFTIEQDEPAAGTVAPVMTEEKIVKPITETTDSYSMSSAPKASSAQVAPITQDQISVNQSSMNMSPAPVMAPASGSSESSMKTDEKSKKGGVSIIPRAGISTLSDSFYDLTPKYMLGVGLGFDVSDYVGIELGYAFNSYGMRMNYGGTELQFKNDSFDIAMKFYLSGLDAKVRPFLGGGMVYSKGYVNYDDRTRMYLENSPFPGDRMMANDYELNQFQGQALAGLEFKIAQNLAIGATYKYLKPFSSNETEQGFAWFTDPNKQALRGTLKDSTVSVYQVSASVTF